MATKKTVTKADLVDQVAATTGLKKKDVKAAVDAFLSKVEEALSGGTRSSSPASAPLRCASARPAPA